MRAPAAPHWYDQPESACALVPRLEGWIAALGMLPTGSHAPPRTLVGLVEEVAHAGGDVILLTRPRGQPPEEPVRWHVQGGSAHYARATVLERSRRGNRPAAREGRVGIRWHAPDGDRAVQQQAGGGEARVALVGDEARSLPPG